MGTGRGRNQGGPKGPKVPVPPPLGNEKIIILRQTSYLTQKKEKETGRLFKFVSSGILINQLLLRDNLYENVATHVTVLVFCRY